VALVRLADREVVVEEEAEAEAEVGVIPTIFRHGATCYFFVVIVVILRICTSLATTFPATALRDIPCGGGAICLSQCTCIFAICSALCNEYPFTVPCLWLKTAGRWPAAHRSKRQLCRDFARMTRRLALRDPENPNRARLFYFQSSLVAKPGSPFCAPLYI
jgi:hypothetical protein